MKKIIDAFAAKLGIKKRTFAYRGDVHQIFLMRQFWREYKVALRMKRQFIYEAFTSS